MQPSCAMNNTELLQSQELEGDGAKTLNKEDTDSHGYTTIWFCLPSGAAGLLLFYYYYYFACIFLYTW